MTDNEIIKAFECCENNCDCLGCPKLDSTEGCNGVAEEILDLINRQKEEITKNENIIEAAEKLVDALRKEIEALIAGQETLQKFIAEKDAEIENLDTELAIERIRRKNAVNAYHEEKDKNQNIKEIKSETVKEFAERLKDEDNLSLHDDGYDIWVNYDSFIERIDNIKKEMVGEG